MKEYKRIVVSLLGPLGDVINTSPVFRRLKECYPNAKIDLVTVQSGVEASYGIPEISNRFIFKKQYGFKGFLEIIKFARRLGKIDLYVCLDNSFRSAFIARLSGAKERIGRKGELKEFLLLNKTIPYLKEEKEVQIPVYEHYYRILKNLKIYDHNNKTSFYYSENDKLIAQKLLQEKCKTEKPKLGLCLLGGNRLKSVEIDNAIEIINRIKALDTHELIVVGGNDVKERVKELNQKTNNAFVDFTGLTNYAQSAYLIDNCEKFISVDTSPMHLAIALKTPTIAIFFSDIYKKWGPEDLNYNRLILNQQNKYVSSDEVIEDLQNMKDKSSYK